MDLGTLVKLQTAADQAPMQHLGELTNSISGIIQNRNARSMEQDAMKFFGDGNVSMEKIQQFQQMYPGVPAVEVMKQAATIGTQVEAQQMKDIYGTIGSMVQENGGKIEPKLFMDAMQKFSPSVRGKFMQLITTHPEFVQKWKQEVSQTDPTKDTVTRDAMGNVTKEIKGTPAPPKPNRVKGFNERLGVKGVEFDEDVFREMSEKDPEWKPGDPIEKKGGTPLDNAVKDMMGKINPDTGALYTASEAYNFVAHPKDKESKVLGLIDLALNANTPEARDKALKKLDLYKSVYAQNIVLGATPEGGLVTGKSRGNLSPTITPSPNTPILDVKSYPLPEKTEDKLTGALDMFDLLDIMEANADVGVPIPGVGEAVTWTQSKLGSKPAQDFLTAKNQLAANAQTIIKGIPSNFDVETFLKTLPKETDTAAEKKTKIAQSKKLLINALRTGIENYENSKFIIPDYIKKRYAEKTGGKQDTNTADKKTVGERTIVETRIGKNGRKMVKYSDGSTEYAD